MKIVEKLLNIIAPHSCVACGAEGSLLCTWCRPDACMPVPSRCYRCSKLTQDFRTCTACRRSSPLHAVWAHTEYEDIAKILVHRLKFERTSAAATVIARLMAETLPYYGRDMVITHVPTASSRYRERGYDQSQLIAKEVARLKGVRYAPLLVRMGQSRQVGASRKRRQVQLEGAFRCKSLHLIDGAEILLVDDILTTGATLEAAAKVLKTGGAKRIHAAVFARKT